jgi:C4-dicarboxylate-specific signal transduction histidine kinase
VTVNAFQAIQHTSPPKNPPTFRIAASSEERRVKVCVFDNGNPVPQDIRERLLKGPVDVDLKPRFSLWLARGAALTYGGDLKLVKSDADGTEFEFTLRIN